jgi:hypothetical protein
MARRKKKVTSTRVKAPYRSLPLERRQEIAAQFTDDVLAKLVDAFFQVVQQEGWGKRDLAAISSMNETAIGHILSGRRKNLKLETIALLARAMKTRPELTLHDLRPKNNNVANLSDQGLQSDSAVVALREEQFKQHANEPGPSLGRSHSHSGFIVETEVAN